MKGKTEFAFSSIPVPEREEKPRKKGLTMMIDWGLGLGRLADTLEMTGDYVDLGKIAVGTPRLYDESLLEWVTAHPEQAVDIAWRRLREGTRDFWSE